MLLFLFCFFTDALVIFTARLTPTTVTGGGDPVREHQVRLLLLPPGTRRPQGDGRLERRLQPALPHLRPPPQRQLHGSCWSAGDPCLPHRLRSCVLFRTSLRRQRQLHSRWRDGVVLQGVRRPVRGPHPILLLHHQGLADGRRGESPAAAEGGGAARQAVPAAAGAGAAAEERPGRGPGLDVSPERRPARLQRLLGFQRVRPVQLAAFTVLQVAARIPLLFFFVFVFFIEESADADGLPVSRVSFPRLRWV